MHFLDYSVHGQGSPQVLVFIGQTATVVDHCAPSTEVRHSRSDDGCGDGWATGCVALSPAATVDVRKRSGL
jgi:hypothetical protein